MCTTDQYLLDAIMSQEFKFMDVNNLQAESQAMDMEVDEPEAPHIKPGQDAPGSADLVELTRM